MVNIFIFDSSLVCLQQSIFCFCDQLEVVNLHFSTVRSQRVASGEGRLDLTLSLSERVLMETIDREK